MDLKLLHKYPRVKGFKALHICNPVKHAETAQTLVRFLISIVLSPLWKGKQMPATKHSNTTAFSEASQFIIGDIKWQWNMFCHSSFVLVWTTSLLLVIRSLAHVLVPCWHETRRYYLPCWASWIFNNQSLKEAEHLSTGHRGITVILIWSHLCFVPWDIWNPPCILRLE